MASRNSALTVKLQIAAGGIGAVLRELKPLLHLDTIDIEGRTLGERLEKEKGLLATLQAQVKADADSAQAEADRLTQAQDAAETSLAADREQLDGLQTRLAAAGAPLFERRLAPIIEKYRAQIEPLGHNVSPRDPAAAGLASEYGLGDYEVVQIEVAGKRRLAQVSHTTTHGLPGTAPQETYAFLRWVDPMFTPMLAGVKTPDTARVLNPDRVVNLPIAEAM